MKGKRGCSERMDCKTLNRIYSAYEIPHLSSPPDTLARVRPWSQSCGQYDAPTHLPDRKTDVEVGSHWCRRVRDYGMT